MQYSIIGYYSSLRLGCDKCREFIRWYFELFSFEVKVRFTGVVFSAVLSPLFSCSLNNASNWVLVLRVAVLAPVSGLTTTDYRFGNSISRCNSLNAHG